MSNPHLGFLSLTGVVSELLGLKGGYKLQKAIGGIAKALYHRDYLDSVPYLLSANTGPSLSGAKTIQMVGANLHQRSRTTPEQVQESLAVFGTVASGNYVLVKARVPGNHGILLTIATPGSAAAADTYGAAPAVAWTPETGDVDASIAALNAASKLVYATKVGTGGTLAAMTQTALAGGKGGNVSFQLGAKVIQDTKLNPFGAAAPGTAAGSYISKWEDDLIEVVVHNTDTGVGYAIPTGRSAAVAAQGHLVAVVGWPESYFKTTLPLQVIT